MNDPISAGVTKSQLVRNWQLKMKTHTKRSDWATPTLYWTWVGWCEICQCTSTQQAWPWSLLLKVAILSANVSNLLLNRQWKRELFTLTLTGSFFAFLMGFYFFSFLLCKVMAWSLQNALIILWDEERQTSTIVFFFPESINVAAHTNFNNYYCYYYIYCLPFTSRPQGGLQQLKI